MTYDNTWCAIIYLIKSTVSQNVEAVCESLTYDSSAFRATFRSNTFKEMFSVWLHQVLRSLWRTFGPLILLHWDLWSFIYVELSQKLALISIRLTSGLWLGHCNTMILFSFSHSVIDFLLGFGSFDWCMITLWTNIFTSVSRSLEVGSDATLETQPVLPKKTEQYLFSLF